MQRPEGKENHHHDLVYEICKTSIPGSNPGGASNFILVNASRQQRSERVVRAALTVALTIGGRLHDVAVDVILPQLPAGIAVEDGFPAEGKLLKIAVREFSSSEDGDAFVRRLEGVPNQLLMMVSATINPSTVDHLVAVSVDVGIRVCRTPLNTAVHPVRQRELLEHYLSDSALDDFEL